MESSLIHLLLLLDRLMDNCLIKLGSTFKAWMKLTVLHLLSIFIIFSCLSSMSFQHFLLLFNRIFLSFLHSLLWSQEFLIFIRLLLLASSRYYDRCISYIYGFACRDCYTTRVYKILHLLSYNRHLQYLCYWRSFLGILV